jgi:glycosyl-4,4'-diaponeurosporenoate acyltransferase
VPEAGAVFAGGFAKRDLRRGDLDRYLLETRRAEYTHWAILAAAPLFLLWNPPAVWLLMVAYAVVANVPCLLIQRYNRARLLRILGRRRSHR